MDIIRMTGGLGNQMFQYALYLKLKSLGREVKFDDRSEYEGREARPILLWVFGLTYPAAGREEINEITDGFMKLPHRVRRRLFGRRSREYHEKDGNFDEQVLQRDPAYLTGYFQSAKYFAGAEMEVRDAFTFSDEIWRGLPEGLLRKYKSYEDQIKNAVSVSVHIRRGDYLENKEVYGGICTEEYYKSAMAAMKEREKDAVFFIFSNEPGWAKEWIGHVYGNDAGYVVVEGTTEDTGYLDMFLMSRCKHYVLANSSFSWWGAWLGANEDKIVMAPSKWFNNQDIRDIYTEDMVKISPEGELAGKWKKTAN